MEITINPLHGLVAKPGRKKVPRPKWMCRHAEAILLDRAKMMYRCNDCNPTLGSITVIPISTTARSPKKVTVSPTEGGSPTGFRNE